MFIGIDLGTSSVKLVLVDKLGNVIKTVSNTYDLLVPKPSWTEQNPEDWFTQTIKGLKDIVKGNEGNIKGISFSGQMHGLVLLDKDDNVLRNAILWNDQRTIEEVNYLNNIVGVETLLQETGNIALTGLTAPKLLWVKQNEPEIFKRISKIMLPKDFLIYRFTKKFYSDVSDLSGTLFFNPATRNYSKKMLDVLCIKENQLPKIVESYDVVGQLLDDIKKQVGISSTTQIIAGGGDQAVGAIGVGAVKDGSCNISLGTSGVIFVSSDNFITDNINHLQSYSHSNGKYHVMAVMLNAAGAIKWWNESILENYDYPEYYNSLEHAQKRDNLFFLPYLTGERSPINDPYAKGILYGLGIHHKRSDINYAVLEGVTFALKESFELIRNLGINIEKARITGGGARSIEWVQLISDVLSIEVSRIQSEEGPALGAAILAMVGCGVYNSVSEACDSIIKIKDTFHPNIELANSYRGKYKNYKKLYPKIKSLYREM